MNHSQTAALLALAAAFDARTIGEADVAAWQDVLADTAYEDAVTVVKAHYTRTRDRIMPVDVLTGVKKIRNDRLDRVVIPPPPPGVDDLQWLRDCRKAIADGTWVEPEPDPTIAPRNVAGLLDQFNEGNAA